MKTAHAINAPQTSNGSALPIEFVGCQTASIDQSTGTSFIVINSTVNGAISTGRAVVYGILTSSISQNDYLVLKDTTGANGATGALASQNSLQMVSATVAVIGNWYQMFQTTTTGQLPYPNLNVIKFPVPIQFRNGIIGNASTAPQSNNGVSRWTIFYRKLDQSER